MVRRTMLRIWAVLALSMLVACGNVSTPAVSLPTADAPGAAPAATALPAPTESNLVATQPALATAVESPAATQPPTASSEQAIPQGLTPEGYHELGRADAPVTLVMYSDFL